MAIVDLNVTYFHRFVPFKSFAGSGEDDLQPLGISWFIGNGTILAKGAGDETHIRATITFPTQYVYILKDLVASIRLTLGTTNNFEDNALIQLDNCAKAPNLPSYFLAIDTQGIAFEHTNAVAADPTQIYNLVNPYKTLIERPDVAASTWILEFVDEAGGATNAGIYTSVICFYVYNLLQAQGSPINTPLPVLSV